MGMNGFIIPDNIQKAMSNYNPKDYGKVSITINSETVSSLEDVVQNLSPDETTFNKNKGLQSSSEGK